MSRKVIGNLDFFSSYSLEVTVIVPLKGRQYLDLAELWKNKEFSKYPLNILKTPMTQLYNTLTLFYAVRGGGYSAPYDFFYRSYLKII